MPTKVQCNSCGTTYHDPMAPGYLVNFHVCPPQIIDTHAVCDETGKVVTPATFKPTPNPRNENLKRKPGKPNEYEMISEGSGVTPVE